MERDIGKPLGKGIKAQTYTTYGNVPGHKFTLKHAAAAPLPTSLEHLVYFKRSNDIYNISYENLVSNQNEEIKKLIDFCELNWDIKCLEFYKNKKSIKTVSFAQARKPIYNSSIKSWENYSSYLDVLKENLNNI